jgi:integrase
MEGLRRAEVLMPASQQNGLSRRTIEAACPGQFLWDDGKRGISGFGLRVTPGGTRTFIYRYRSHAKQRFLTLGRYPTLTIEQARKLARIRAGEVGVGSDPQAARKALRDAPTMASLVSVYLDEYAPSQALRAATVRNARALLTIATARLGSMKVAEVAITDIRKLHGDMRAEGIASGHKGVYQANRLLAVLSKMFSLAIERGWRTDNPCKGVRKFPEDQRWRNLSEDEVGRLLAACDDYEAGVRPVLEGEDPEVAERKQTQLPDIERSATDREAADAVRLLLFTGARLREVLMAEWRQFDLEGGLWEKPSAHTKSKRQHRLELDGPSLALLKAMAEHKRDPVYLFPGNPELRRKGVPLDIRTGQPKGIAPRADLRHPWRMMRMLAGLEGVRLHDLRRTTASFMLSEGSSLATVGKALGHTQASTTARYATLAASVQREGLKAAGERMAGLKSKATRGSVQRGVQWPIKT